MADIKSLADQIRQELKQPGKKEPANKKPGSPEKKAREKQPQSDFLTALKDFDTSANKSMVHVRFDEKTVRLMNQFKMATGVDVSKFVAFAVKELLSNTTDIKIIIKHFIQNTDL